jgi:hypothetical protein
MNPNIRGVYRNFPKKGLNKAKGVWSNDFLRRHLPEKAGRMRQLKIGVANRCDYSELYDEPYFMKSGSFYDGKKLLGTYHVSILPQQGSMHVDNITGKSVNKFGAKKVRKLLKALTRREPKIKKIEAQRITGARQHDTGRRQLTTIPVKQHRLKRGGSNRGYNLKVGD